MTPWPLPIRGVLYDVVQMRKEFDSLASFHRLVKFLADCRLNTLVLYLDDLWQLRSHPDLAHPHAYAVADLVGLAQEARAQGIDFIPSITTLGHSGAKLRRPAYQHLAFPNGGDFDVFNPAMYDLFADIFDEILPHFPSPYCFINGDETNYVHLSDQARAEARAHGLGALYGRAMGRLCRMVLDRGRRPIIWHDMLLHHPEATDAIPRETVIAYWYYDHQPPVAIDYFTGLGFDVIGASGLVGTVRGLPNLARHLPAIRQMIAGCATAARPQPETQRATPTVQHPTFTGTPSLNVERLGACLGTLLTIWCDIRWQDTLLPLYALGRWAQEPDRPLTEVLAEFAADVFGFDQPDLGPALVDAVRQASRVDLGAARGDARPPTAPTLEGERFASRDRTARSDHNADLLPVVENFTHRLLPPLPAVAPPPHAAPRPLLAPALLDGSRTGCQIVHTQTAFGHDLLVLSTGRLAITLLPAFAATMIEWVVLDPQPWSALMTGYETWAAREPRVAGDPGLGSYGAAAGIHGWRETIFFNSRLNPCTLWGRPFTVAVEESPAGITCRCHGSNEAAEVRRTIRLARDSAALDIETSATARRGSTWLAIRPNVVHALPDTPSAGVRLMGDSPQPRGLLDHDGTMHFIPSAAKLTLESTRNQHALTVSFSPGEVECFLTDCAPNHFTLEPFGAIRACQPGDEVRLALRYELH